MPRRPKRATARGRAALAWLCAFAALAACMAEDGHAVADEADTDTDTDAAERPTVTARTRPAVAEDGPRHDAACTGYCEAFARACDEPLAYADRGECLATCEGWALGEPGVRGPSVACHAAMVPGSGGPFGSCIAAGPESPICAEV